MYIYMKKHAPLSLREVGSKQGGVHREGSVMCNLFFKEPQWFIIAAFNIRDSSRLGLGPRNPLPLTSTPGDIDGKFPCTTFWEILD